MVLVLSCLSKFVSFHVQAVLVLSLCVAGFVSTFVSLSVCLSVSVFCTSDRHLILPVPLFVRLVPCHSL